MKGAFEQSMAALREGPRLMVPANADQPQQHGLDLATALMATAAAMQKDFMMNSQGSTDPSAQFKTEGKQEVLGALATLQRNIEAQQGQQSNLIATLTGQWEQRFAALEQAVNSGLKIATTTAASMNERSAKFLRLGEVLEGALDRIVDDGKDMATLSQTVGKTQREVERLIQELADEKGERRQAIVDVVRQAEGQVAALRERVESAGGTVNYSASAPSGKDANALERLQSDVGKLTRDFSEEQTERRQLARELQLAASDTATLRQRVDGTQDQLLRLSRELNSTRDEVRQVAGEVARVWSAEISGGSALRSELRNEFSQRIDALSRELRGGAQDTRRTQTAIASATTVPRSGSAGGEGFNRNANQRMDAGMASPNLSNNQRSTTGEGGGIDAMRKDIASEIVAAVRATEAMQKGRAPDGSHSRRGTSSGSRASSATNRRPATIPEEETSGSSGTAAAGGSGGMFG